MTTPRDSQDSDAELLLGKVADEFLQRHQQGEAPDVEEYANWHPELADVLRQMLPALRLLGGGATVKHSSRNQLGAIEGSTQDGVEGASTQANFRKETQPPESPPGYEILNELGRGGMGVVYKAHHLSLQRIVALKMIRAGELADEKEILRFRTEARAVAQLQHPNVVQIFEVSEYHGRPFFSLEFVDGGSLADKLNGEPQSPENAANQLHVLAEAIDAVHDQGLVHRDLKPANVLIGTDGTLKITDFGLVKRPEEPGITKTGAVVGTPSYLAPEQVSGTSEVVGPSADIYALGAILYEMLTGRPPFRGIDAIETLMLVRTKEPIAPRQFQANCPRDLETICLKCLEKDPRKRYSRAAELRNDLDLYLQGLPIQARPVGPAGRLIRWSKRSPMVAALTATAVSAAIIGTTISTYFGVSATQRSAELDQQAGELRIALDRGDKLNDQAKQSIDRYVDTVLEDDLLSDIRFQQLRKTLLADALTYYDQFVREFSQDPNSKKEVVEAVQRVGSIYQKSGLTEEALLAFQKALTLYEELLEDEPSDDIQFQLALVHNSLGRQHRDLGDYDKARLSHDTGLEVVQELAVEHPDVAEYKVALAAAHGSIGVLLRRTGKANDALASLDEAAGIYRKLVEDYPDELEYQHRLASTHGNRAAVLHDIRKLEESLVELETNRDILHGLIPRDPSDAKVRADLGKTLRSIGITQSQISPTNGLDSIQQAIEIDRRLALEFPTVSQYQENLANSYTILGAFYGRIGNQELALEATRAARPIQERLEIDHPTVTRFSARVAMALSNEAESLRRMKRLSEALPLFDQAIEKAQAIRARVPNDGETRFALRAAYSGKAELMASTERLAEAIASWESSLEFAPPRSRPRIQSKLAATMARTGDYTRAIETAKQSLNALGVSGFEFYQCCLAHAISSTAVLDDESLDLAHRKTLSQKLVDEAIVLLRKSYEAGHFQNPEQIAQLDSDPELSALRDRDEFRALVDHIRDGLNR